MESFSSFLELMAAFNFAYVLGQDYLKEILLRGLGITSRIKVKTEKMVTQLKDLCDIIDSESENEIIKKEDSKNKIRDIIIPSLEQLKQNYKLDFNNLIPFGFPQLCLIGGVLCLYTILIICFSGLKLSNLGEGYFVICHIIFSYSV